MTMMRFRWSSILFALAADLIAAGMLAGERDGDRDCSCSCKVLIVRGVGC